MSGLYGECPNAQCQVGIQGWKTGKCFGCGDPLDNLDQKPAKYRAVPCYVDGIRFDSKKEARRYAELLLLDVHDEIVGLERQVPYDISIKGTRICRYYLDFRYHDAKTGKVHHEDVKGVRTPVFRLKKRMVEATFGFEIEEL